jgi:hypothetical protein
MKVKNIQRLMKQFKVQACEFDSGVKGFIDGKYGGSKTLYFGYYEWEWLEPLLKELIMLRKKGRVKYEDVKKEL